MHCLYAASALAHFATFKLVTRFASESLSSQNVRGESFVREGYKAHTNDKYDLYV